MPQIVPLDAVASQEVTIPLGNQVCQLKVYEKFYGLFMDVSVNDTLIIGGVICENKNRIVREAYRGFVGDFCFIDTQGDEDPSYDGIGTRFFLSYLSEADLLAQGLVG